MQPKNQKYRVLLTGASRGIGAAIAQKLAPLSERIYAVSRKPQIEDSLRSSSENSKFIFRYGDVTDRHFLASLLTEVSAAGGINLLINNAGVSEFGDFSTQSQDSIQQMAQVNLIAPMLMSQTFLPVLTKEPSAQIINIGSALGYIGYPGYTAYCATKFGLRGFTQALDRELGESNVRARLFSPRATKTDINPDAVRRMNQDLGVQEDDVHDVAQQLIEFLAKDADEFQVGFPESLFRRINQIAPSVVKKNIAKQLPRIRAAFKEGGH